MPIPLYRVNIYSPTTGALRAQIINWRSLYYEKWVNNSHNYQLALESADPNIQYFELDAIVEVWRRVPGYDWYREITCMHRTSQWNLEENGREIFTSYGRGLNDLLNRRNLLYYANTAFTLKDGPGETVMKELVEENAAAGADNAARRSFGQYTAATYGLTVASDSGLGDSWKGAMAWRNLLDQLKEIALTTSVDFEVLRTGPLTFVFNTYYPQRGTDRSATLTFAPYLGNMSNVIYADSRVEEANIVAVLGPGEESSRQVVIRKTLAGADSLWNNIETTRDARNQPDLASMQSTGDAALEETKAHQTFTFATLQTDTRQYGIVYDVGDKIRANYKVDVIKKIVCARVTVSRVEPIETVQLEFADIVD